MRDYGRVHSSFWTSATIRSMSEDARSLALYLLTSPHSTIAGVFRLPDGYVCEDLQWTAERVAEGFAELLSNGFANRCGATKWVWICKYLDWNPPENPNQKKSASKIVLTVPLQCGWLRGFSKAYASLLSIDPKRLDKGSETPGLPFLNQEQEQEQYQDNPELRSGRLRSASGDDPKADLYALTKQHLGPKAGGFTAKFLKVIGSPQEALSLARQAFDDAPDIDAAKAYIGAIIRDREKANGHDPLTARDRGDEW